MSSDPTVAALSAHLLTIEDDLLRARRDLHRNPEPSWEETRSTRVLREALERAGLAPTGLDPTGLVVDVGPAQPEYRVALRADIDALRLPERTDLPFRSRNEGVSHACGHDVHAAVTLGAVLALHAQRPALEARGLGVRAIFQPAEETMPGGSLMVVDRGHLDDVDAVFALHCDPGRDVGHVGLKRGPITAASDEVRIHLSGPGGHTSRPHLTADIVYALGQLVVGLPGALSRRVDPRAGAALVWGSVHAGSTANAIPDSGELVGTLRILDAIVWESIEPLVHTLVQEIVAPFGVTAELRYTRGVPPVVSSAEGVDAMRLAVHESLGSGAAQPAEQSLGGEDFAWMLRGRRGAFARLGTRTPGGPTYDLHRGDLVIDERAILLGARFMATVPFAARRVLLADQELRA